MDSGVIATLEADADNLRSELQRVADELEGLGQEAERVVADEEEFGIEREQSLATIEVVATSSAQ